MVLMKYHNNLQQSKGHFMSEQQKSRINQEYVPGKQITLAHVITKPRKSIYKKLGLPGENADSIGILTITPSEAAIIAADICTKAAGVELGFIDRFSGSVVVVGEVGDTEAAVTAVLNLFSNKMGFDVVAMTKS